MSAYVRRPRFSKGKILRTEYLVALERQSFDMPNLLFDGWSNGVISGCRLTTTQDTITMLPGLVCFEGVVYGIQHPVHLEYAPTDTTTYVKLHISSNEGNDSCEVRRFSIACHKEEGLGSGELELCRFRLQPGAYLRCSYKDFRDRETLYDTLNLIHSTCSAPNGPGIHPDLTRAYAQEVLSLDTVPDLDGAVCLGWLNEKFSVPAWVVQSYLQRCGCWEEQEDVLQGLYRGLLDRLEQLKQGISSESPSKRTQRRMMLID